MSTGDQLLSNLDVLTSASHLPTSPWIYHVPASFIEVTVLYLQVIVVSEVDLLVCLTNAANDVIAHMTTAGSDELIHKQELDWDSGLLRLRLNAGHQMTWAMWGATIQGLTHFLEMYDPISMLFEVREQLLGESVGSGAIFNI